MALYERRILNDPNVRLAYGDPLIPLVRPDEVSLELSNEDAYFDTLDLRGERVTYDRFDATTQEQLSELSGIVVDQQLTLDRVILRTMTQDLDDLQTLLPKRLVNATTFPLAPPQLGLGWPIPIVFGNAASTNTVNDAWELPYVTENTLLNQYDYLLGEGTLTNATIYRNTIGEALFEVPANEYTITSSAYVGYTVARFALRQANFSGGMHRIFGAANGLQPERSPAIAAQSILGNTAWGLGLTVNSASFATGADIITAVGSLYCDGVIAEQRPAIEWLSHILLFRRMSPSKNTSGQWTLSVDAQPTMVQATFGHGEDLPWRNVRDFRGVRKTPVGEAIRSLILDYRRDHYTGRYILSTSTRSTLSFGKDLRLENNFIRDRTTADKVADFLSKQLLHGDSRLSFTAGQEARKLRPGDLIHYESTHPVIDATFQVTAISRKLDVVDIEGRGWNADIYAYTAGTLPSEPAATTNTDWSRTTPAYPTSVSVIASGVEQNDQGVNAAYLTIQYTVPDQAWAYTEIRYGVFAGTLFATIKGENGAGVKTTKITGLTGGVMYDIYMRRVNTLNPSLVGQSLLSPTAVGDTTPPSDPTAIAVRQDGGKTVEIDATFTAPADWGATILYRNTTNSSGSATEIERGKKKRFHDQSVSYGFTYYYWVKVADLSGNLSGFSPSSAHSITVVQIVTADVTDLNVTTGKVAANAITVDGLYSSDSGAPVLTTTEQEIGTLTISTDGGTTIIKAKCNVAIRAVSVSSGIPAMTIYLRKDAIITGEILDVGTIWFTDSTTDYLQVTTTLIGRDSSPAATQTYKLSAVESNTNTIASVGFVRLLPLNRKK